MRHLSPRSKTIKSALSMFFLVFTVACGGAATATQVPPVATTGAVGDLDKPATAATAPTQVPSIVVVPTAVPVPVPSEDRPEWVSRGKHCTCILPMVVVSDGGFWDVHYGGSSNSTLRPSSSRFNGLLERDPVQADQIISDLAESWEVADDGTTYTFRIHEATWSDGVPITGKDIVFTLDRIVEPGAIRARTAGLRRFYEQGTARVIDDRTVEVPTKFPAVTFLLNMSSEYMKMYPEHVVSQRTQDELNGDPFAMIGSGPWVFKEWKRQVSFEYERNPNYFKEGLPFFDGWKGFIVRDKARVRGALLTGQVWMTYGASSRTPPVDAVAIEEESEGALRSWVIPINSVGGFFINFTEPPFDNPKVRRAMYLALDREELVQSALFGFGKPGSHFQLGMVLTEEELAEVPGWRYVDGAGLPVASPFGVEGVVKDPRDIEEAKALLEEAGFPDGFKSDVNVSNSPTTLVAAEVATEQLRRNIGIDLTIHPVDLPSYYANLRDAPYPVSYGHSGIPVPDPSEVLGQWFARPALRNPHNWSHPQIDELTQSQEKEFDPTKRREIFKEMETLLQGGESHFIPTVWVPTAGVIDRRIQNWIVPINDQMAYKIEHIWFDPDAGS